MNTNNEFQKQEYFTFRTCINQNKIDWRQLSKNPNAINLLEANQEKIDWYWISLNPNAIHLLEANQNKIDWEHLSGNPNAIHLLEANQDKIDWCWLSLNPNAIHLLEANLEKTNWFILSYNPNATHLLQNKQHKVISDFNHKILNNYGYILYVIQTNHNKINWRMLCDDLDTAEIIEAHFDISNEIDFSVDPNVLNLLKSAPNENEWANLSSNPNIFTYDYERIKHEHEWLSEGLIEHFYHPRFIQKWLDDGNNIDDYL